MSNSAAVGEAQFRRLRADYEDTFRQLSSQVRLMQSLTSQSVPDSMLIKDARGRVEDAQTAYRESRDLLAEFVLAWPAKTEALIPSRPWQEKSARK